LSGESKRIADRLRSKRRGQKEQAEKRQKRKRDRKLRRMADTAAETYMQNKDSRIPVIQDIFKKSLKDIADFTVGRQQVKLLVLIDNINDFRCKERRKSFLYLHNRASRKTFEMLTASSSARRSRAPMIWVDSFRDGNEFAVKGV
jgi:hypothetical protein